MPVVSVLSLKGGVGKTTVTLGLAGAALARGLSVLVVDLDPQANATTALDPAGLDRTVGDVLADARPGIAAEALTPSGWSGPDGARLDVLGAEPALEHRNRPEGRASELRLRTSLEGVANRYDLVVVDCPPSLGELTKNALAASARAVVVTEPTLFALQGAQQAMDAVEVLRGSLNLRLRAVGIVVNRVRPTAEHRFRTGELGEAYGNLVLDPPLPERTAIAQAQGAAVAVQAWRSQGAREASAVFDAYLDRVLASLAADAPLLTGRPAGSGSSSGKGRR